VTAAVKTKVYGETDPELTYTVAPALIGTDEFTGTLERTTGENIGDHAIGQGNLTLNSNYAVTFVPANLSITAKTIMVAAVVKTKEYGEADPELTYTFSPALIGTDGFTGSLIRVVGEKAGAYAINKNNLSLSGNYILDYTAANLNITKAQLTISAENKEKFVGTTNPVLTVTYNGFKNNETSAVLIAQPAISTTATAGSLAGNYPITANGAIADNYNINYVAGTLKVVAGAPTDINIASVTVYENSAIGTNAATFSSTSENPLSTFTYTLMAGAGDTDNGLFTISGNKINTASVLDFESKSNYSIRIKSTTQYGTSMEKVFIIALNDVNETPTLAAVDNQNICFTTTAQTVALTGVSAGPEANQSTTLTVSSSNSNLFETLTISGSGATAKINYKVKAGAIAGTATITVTVKDNGGTANGGVDTYSRTFVVTVNALPIAAINSDKGTQISKGETVLLNATGGSNYVWAAHNSIISGQHSATLAVRPSETTTYTVTVTNSSGCSETRSITLTVLEDFVKVKATNIMSPNGDGVNDKWVIDNLDLYPNNEVKVFDRTGRLLFGKKGYDNSWDATLNGLPLAEGTYYYIIDFGTKRPKIKGFITITRSEQTR
ncbi:MBG domain-containing protein, partial [Pedobacter nyackensis]|uniref:MBG domain-containing protein n=1 Tax=Pedobacter nyackensis TaxID=475255 RepID=UPI00292E0F03